MKVPLALFQVSHGQTSNSEVADRHNSMWAGWGAGWGAGGKRASLVGVKAPETGDTAQGNREKPDCGG